MEKGLSEAARNREAIIDHSLQQLYSESTRAYRFTLVLLVLGSAIGGGIAIRVVRGIRRSLQRLTEAVRETAEERFDPSFQEIGDDEFGRLAGEFVQMGIKLRDLKRQHLDANPLTHLPGNLAIERELERRIASGEAFAHVYIDLDHFKAYGDRYGYQKGSDVLLSPAN
ncbi:MAG: adenylate/guanylate cyclase domain-containing protein [Comamonadaceae bacterium]|nr:adenylate/guanylate cyclase domain-containing protein [Comamonadaceae bacterium]